MRIAYYPETDSMYIDFSAKESVESKGISPGVVLYYDFEGNITGIYIDNASKKLDLQELTLSKIPESKQVIAA